MYDYAVEIVFFGVWFLLFPLKRYCFHNIYSFLFVRSSTPVTKIIVTTTISRISSIFLFHLQLNFILNSFLLPLNLSDMNWVWVGNKTVVLFLYHIPTVNKKNSYAQIISHSHINQATPFLLYGLSLSYGTTFV